jgi:hypothetical protein
MNNILTNDSVVQQFVEKLEAHMKEVSALMSKTDDVKKLSLCRGEIANSTNILQSITKIRPFYIKLEKLDQ